MLDIILTLVFSSAILVLMIYPAIKIVEFIERKRELSEKAYNILTVILTIILSVSLGLLLHFS